MAESSRTDGNGSASAPEVPVSTSDDLQSAASDPTAGEAAAAPASSGAPASAPSRARSVVRGIVAALAVAAIVFCGWALSEYAQDRDPLAFLSGESAQQATGSVDDDAQEAETANRESAADGQESDGDSADGTGDDAALDSADGSSASGGEDAFSSDGSGSASSATSSSGGSSSAKGSGSKASGSSSSSKGSSSSQSATAITVSVTVDGSAAGANRSSASVSLAKGSTVYDALKAIGCSLDARSTSFGTYIAAIDGLAEKQHGSMSGWVYAVNGVEPNTACSNYELSDGDTVVWTYVNVTK